MLLARWKSRIPWLVILPPQYDAGNAEENGVMDFELSVIEKIDTFTHVCLVNKVHSQQPVSLAKHIYWKQRESVTYFTTDTSAVDPLV